MLRKKWHMRKVKYKTPAQQFAEDKMKQIAKGCTPLVRKRTLRYWQWVYHINKGKVVKATSKRNITYIDTSTLSVVEE